jgi:hypothetical protein
VGQLAKEVPGTISGEGLDRVPATLSMKSGEVSSVISTRKETGNVAVVIEELHT